MYRIQSSSKRHLINLAYLGVKLKKTLAITCEAFRCHNIQTEDKKVFHSSEVNILGFFATLMFYIQFLLLPSTYSMANTCLWTFLFICSHTHLSQVQQSSLLERSWNGDDLGFVRD